MFESKAVKSILEFLLSCIKVNIVIKDRDTFCPERCEKYRVCKEMADAFTELQDSFFFYPKQSLANNFDQVPYHSVLWPVFNSVIDKKNKNFRIKIGKSIPHTCLVLDYGKTVDCAFIHFSVKQYYIDIRNHHRFCCCFNCKRLESLLNEMGKWSFHNLNQFHDKWFIIFD